MRGFMGLVEKVPWLIVRLFLTFILMERCRALPLSGYGAQQGRSVARRQQIERPPSPSNDLQRQDLLGDRKQYTRTKSVTVTCHEAWMEIVVKADLYATGALIDGADLRLGGETLDACRARPSGAEEYTIIAALSDCGNKHLITDDSLIYTNLLVYSPMPSSNGIIRMESVVIPIECHYGRRYGVSSSVLQPTWIPFASTMSAENILGFALRLVTSDWHSERATNVYFLGDTIHIEASVTLDYHVPLRLFVESCVATVVPDKSSVPRYAFIENDGCLTDARLTGSSSHFLPRAQDNMLQIHLDAFRFRQETRSALYITCHLKAVPVMHNVDSKNRACSSINGRWRSTDGNDRICDSCEAVNSLDQRIQSGRPSNLTVGGYYDHHGKPVEDRGSFMNKPRSGMGMEKEVSLPPLEVFSSVDGNVFPRSKLLDNGSVENKASRMSETDVDKELKMEATPVFVVPPKEQETGPVVLLDEKDEFGKEITRSHLGDPLAKEDASAVFDYDDEEEELENETTLGPVIKPSMDYAGPMVLASEEPVGSAVPPSKDKFSPAVPRSREDATPAVPPGQQSAELMETSPGFLDPGMEQEGPLMIPTSEGDNPMYYPELEMDATPGSVVPPREQETSPAVLLDEKYEFESETTLGPVINPSMDYAGPMVLAGEEAVGSAVSPSKGAGAPVAHSEEETNTTIPPGKDEFSPAVPSSREDDSGWVDGGGFMDYDHGPTK
ncbi:hypothetical protein AAFF_G00376990 [Aldrovandia affinis]|uniref:Zona pellucida sperm-binding protein 3 n=1 Tax=Aldrovandia affinis TaxID=143900 RepID=A0AAD7WM20_9TELE|nr:hypothetical protein AAFF_G00376990 [Aldrovandia affinis]